MDAIDWINSITITHHVYIDSHHLGTLLSLPDEWTEHLQTPKDLSLLRDLTQWDDICGLPTCISVTIDQKNDSSGISTTLRSHKAKYHKTCRSYCWSSCLKRTWQKQDKIPDISPEKLRFKYNFQLLGRLVVVASDAPAGDAYYHTLLLESVKPCNKTAWVSRPNSSPFWCNCHCWNCGPYWRLRLKVYKLTALCKMKRALMEKQGKLCDINAI